ncbi:hypothetical protein D3880_03245 [Pseudomonas cavernae]|uniref:Uncharacterized protein n=1 Tax=Pseudomonas cavernae TaxID=2320867 RepID=A0A385YXN0_9PSED|nr:hypothetical protein D3880_03245 [Pseudomonas cavernae]
MPIALKGMAQLMLQAERVAIAQNLQHAHSIGTTRKAVCLSTGFVVDMLDQAHVDQHIVTY